MLKENNWKESPMSWRRLGWSWIRSLMLKTSNFSSKSNYHFCNHEFDIYDNNSSKSNGNHDNGHINDYNYISTSSDNHYSSSNNGDNNNSSNDNDNAASTTTATVATTSTTTTTNFNR